MGQLTLVAFYGEKRGEFAALLGECQARVAAALGSAFQPYPLPQIHATILGFESVPNSCRLNANFAKLRGKSVEMDWELYLQRLEASARIPFRVQFGGFAEKNRAFTSRGRNPFERSFSIQGDKVVLVGWPVREVGAGYPMVLDDIRRAGQQFGILHSYHAVKEDVDNDLFLRLGMMEGTVVATKVAGVQKEMRSFLAGREPLLVDVTWNDLRVVDYEDNRLPVETTRVIRDGRAA